MLLHITFCSPKYPSHIESSESNVLLAAITNYKHFYSKHWKWTPIISSATRHLTLSLPTDNSNSKHYQLLWIECVSTIHSSSNLFGAGCVHDLRLNFLHDLRLNWNIFFISISYLHFLSYVGWIKIGSGLTKNRTARFWYNSKMEINKVVGGCMQDASVGHQGFVNLSTSVKWLFCSEFPFKLEANIEEEFFQLHSTPWKRC